jgi:hypothetical protein
MTMRLISVNVGQPRQVVWKGRTVTTGIFKDPVAGRVPLRQHNLDGDAQADLSVQGGRGRPPPVAPGTPAHDARSALGAPPAHRVAGRRC